MDVGVVEAGHHQPALQLHDAGGGTDEARDRRVVAHRDHPIALDRDRGGGPSPGHEDVAAAQDEVGSVGATRGQGSHEAQ